MRILLTNDDGIHAPGIIALHHALTNSPADPPPTKPTPTKSPPTKSPFDEVVTVAPLTVQSATGHGLTFHKPLAITNETVNDHMQGIAVNARPADCVKLALTCLWPDRFGEGARPDLVISGMNAGANCGINVIYSGTVAAALEAAFLGVPAIAVSLMLGNHEPDYACGATHARRAIDAVLAHGPLEPHTCLSINIPPCEADNPHRHDPLPLKVCPMNTHGLQDGYERRVSPGGAVYYWANRSGLEFRHTDPGSDVSELFAGAITLTPLKYDLTEHDHLHLWQGELEG
ncbi:MAG: 5'/3'-nucleotidase SurE [Planctomycetota bacterium]|nr:5'/3'-nucleotidase SurE [Planctomycetota bacterium]